MVTWGHRKNLLNIIFSLPQYLLTPNLTNGDLIWGILLLRSHDPSVTWSYQIMWQIKNVASLLPPWLWRPNGHLKKWLHDVNEILKTLYLHYHNGCGHENWQGSNVPYGAPTYKVDPLIKWSSEVKWQIKLEIYVIYLH